MQVEITAYIDALREHFCGADGSFEMLVGHDWGTQSVANPHDSSNLLGVGGPDDDRNLSVPFTQPVGGVVCLRLRVCDKTDLANNGF